MRDIDARDLDNWITGHWGEDQFTDEDREQDAWEKDREENGVNYNVIIGISEQDNREDVDEAYGAGTYDRLFPPCKQCGSRPCECEKEDNDGIPSPIDPEV